MNVPLVVAGSLAFLAAAIHGGAGQALVIRRLSLRMLPPTLFGGPEMTKTMIWVSWHIATIAFLAVGAALVLSGSVLHGDSARAVGLIAAGASTGFAVLALGAKLIQGPRFFRTGNKRAFLHFGPEALTVIAVLAWVGIA
jgi:hypothetical protein